MNKKEYPALGETVYTEKLGNGLTVCVDTKPEFGKQFAFFATNYGGMNMRFRIPGGDWQNTPAGVAHYLEHKMFDTEDGNALQALAANGVDPNAFTSSSITGYYFEGAEGFEENLKILLSFVSVPYFTKESVDKEQGIIGQEIRMCEDNPDIEVFYHLMEALYEHNPVRVKVAGTVESIAEITAETLYQCHKAFYNPGNMVLCVAGSVDPKRVCEIAAEVLPKTASPVAETDYGAAEKQTAHEHFMECRMAVASPLFQLGFKCDPAEGEQRLRQRLLAELVCDALLGSSSPLYARLYEEGLINGSFTCGYEDEPGCAFIAAGGESKDPRKVRDAVLKEASRVASEGFDAALWDRQKKAGYGEMVRQLNSLENICIENAQAHFIGADYLRFPELYQSITKEDGEELVRRWFAEERSALSIVWPKEEEA